MASPETPTQQTEPQIVERATVQEQKNALARVSVGDLYAGMNLKEFASLMIQSELFPTIKSVSEAAVKIQLGRELGIAPIEALRGLYVHRGRIGIMANIMASKIKESGRYDYELLKSDDKECQLEFYGWSRRKGGWVSLGVSSFTIDQAKKAGLVKADSGWATFPEDMLFARAVSRGQRRFCPDVFKQPVYTKQELDDMALADKEAGRDAQRPGGPGAAEATQADGRVQDLFEELLWPGGRREAWLAEHGDKPVEEQVKLLQAELAADRATTGQPAREEQSPPPAPEPPAQGQAELLTEPPAAKPTTEGKTKRDLTKF